MPTDQPGRLFRHRGVCPLLLGAAILLALLPARLGLAAPSNSFHGQQVPDSLKKDYALIYGTVWGPAQRPVAGIPVSIRQASAKKPKWQRVSDSRGEFAQRVPVGPGDYIVEADVKVPKGQPKPSVKVHIEGDERQDVGLHLAGQDSK